MKMDQSHSLTLCNSLPTIKQKCNQSLSKIALAIVLGISVFIYAHSYRTTHKTSDFVSDNHRGTKENIRYPCNPGTSQELLRNNPGTNKEPTIRTTAGLSKQEPETKYFTKVIDVEHYMYSAIVNLDSSILDANITNDTSITNCTLSIVITSMDASNATYTCCVIFKDITNPFVTPASLYFSYTNRRNVYLARQYNCSVPINSLHRLPQKVTLATSQSCPTNPDNYVTILYPPRLPGRIALCGKVVYGNGRDPDEIIEWFEIQRTLGVDKILIYDLGVPDALNFVFRYYQSLGFLDVQPYELLGKAKNRTLSKPSNHWNQYDEDQTMAVLECRQRMGGYDYIISHDLDEMIIPRKHEMLKSLFEESKTWFPKAAAFVFHTEYFITTWQPTDPEEALMVKRYRLATLPKRERYTYFYRPSRVLTSTIHHVHPISTDFSIERMPAEVARIHHYGECSEDDRDTCQVDKVADDIIMRYTDLDERVLKAREAVWMPVESRKSENETLMKVVDYLED